MIPSQEEVNFHDPEQHFVWALRNMPTMAGAGMITHPGYLKLWSKHLWECGFAHRDYLAGLADENGMISVDKLPRQRIQFQKAMRGARNIFNNAATWVPVGTPAPKLIKLPDITQLTREENEAMLQQYRDAGMIGDAPLKPDVAEVIR
jgi:hypothetical protein